MLRRCFLRSLAAAPAGLALTPCGIAQQRAAAVPIDPFKPGEGANNPVGTGKGIYPGRVVWTRDAGAVSWDGVTGHWWDDAYTDQKAVHGMTSRLLESLTARKNERQSWDALFRNFNETHQGGRSGYRRSETIAIKVNCNQDRSPEWGVPSPREAAAR